jgi:ArsR family transcriptional regulator
MKKPLNSVFNALSDPTRRIILELLRSGDLSAGEIVSHFNISGASISHHLSILKNAELVQIERKGQQIIYSLDTTVFDDLIGWIQNISKRSKK